MADHTSQLTVHGFMDIKGKDIAVVGAGASGIAATRLLSHMGARVRVLERQKGNLDKDIYKWLVDNNVEIRFGEHSTEDFKGVSIVVLSPGVPIHNIKQYVSGDVLIISELELGSRFLKDEEVIAITGTNGKTTTVGLISQVFTGSGIGHFVGGNFGTPLCEYVMCNKREDVVLLEVSSFQLQNIVDFRPNIGVFLNFSPNHLDFHLDIEEYLKCKMNLFKNQTEKDCAIINDSLREIITGYPIRSNIEFFSKFNKELGSLLGEHNLENIGAAWSVCKRFQIDIQTFEKSVSKFTPFSHRLEFIGEINGVRFYNDSKSTTLESLRAAINSFSGNILLISGGILKGGSPEQLLDDLTKKVVQVAVFGSSAKVFFEKWNPYLPVFWEKDLKTATEKLFFNARRGDIILFSPGCSSFDMFSNYRERGDFFKKVVRELSLNISQRY